MALTSPGVEVTIIDQSQYLPAPPNSVPLVVVATAQNKADASGTGVAAATTAANAGKLYQVTSQRDLINLYGTPFFYTTTNGTPIQGYELNEYGLLAAYSLLGVTNRCYVLRADIDLASLVGQTGRPVGAPTNGTYWLNTTNTSWGIFEFNETTGKFTEQTPIVLTNSSQFDGIYPLQSIGQIGDYAVNAIDNAGGAPTGSFKTYYYKTTANQWTNVGSSAWNRDIPTIIGTESNPTLSTGTFDIQVYGFYNNFTTTVSITTGDTVDDVAAYINSSLNYTALRAQVRNGKLCLFSDQTSPFLAKLVVSANTGTVLSELGIGIGTYYQAMVQYGPSNQMPLWTTSQTNPRPTGSVWFKTGAAGNGFSPVMSHYVSNTATWINDIVHLDTSNWSADAALDSTGGKNIPAGTIYSEFFMNGYVQSGRLVGGITTAPIYYWRRLASGPTVVTGLETNVTFSTAGTLSIQVSLPGQSSLTSVYTATINSGDTASDFVTAWSAAGVPYTTCGLTTDGAIQITHTEGGEIVVSDYDPTTNVSAGILSAAGFDITTNINCQYGPGTSKVFSGVPTVTVTGVGSGGTLNITASYGAGFANPTVFGNPGSGYNIGDTIKVLGTSLGGATPANDIFYTIAEVDGSNGLQAITYQSGSLPNTYSTIMTNWVDFNYTANEGAPAAAPANNTNWFYSVVNQVDIMVNTTTGWRGYKNINYDQNGFPTTTGSNATDPNGPIVSASAPTTQSDGTGLVYGDLWIDTADLEMYPVIYRWQSVSDGGTYSDQWVLIDTTDQVSSSGIAFADARWSSDQNTISPIDDPIPTITSLLTSNNIDLDCPSSSLYPVGMLLWNTRRSGYNVKQFRSNYFNGNSFPGASLPTITDTWVSVSGNDSKGTMYAGRKAQRAMVVKALNAVIETNTSIRDEDNFFNLIATPNYPECQQAMVVLNRDRGETGYIIGDTPMRLSDSATDIQAYANTQVADGGPARYEYMGLFYPSGLANDLSGNQVAVPPSHMMLRTFLRNDTIAYPWFAAAGTRRGTIDNALSIGYLDGMTGEFQTIKTRIGIRDVLYTNFINPLVYFTGNGLLNYGNKSSKDTTSALDRTNVGRLIAYIRRQLTVAARPFVFEPNDALTRSQIAGVVETLMVDLVAKRGIYDYLVVCDESNNTPARIDRNELWIDVAIEPVKAVEFIYIPVRILNTGELKAL